MLFDMDLEEVIEKSARNKTCNPLVDLVTQLNESIVYAAPDNIKTNKKLWDNYSREWNVSTEWVQKMASDVQMDNDLKTLGERIWHLVSLDSVNFYGRG